MIPNLFGFVFVWDFDLGLVLAIIDKTRKYSLFPDVLNGECQGHQRIGLSIPLPPSQGFPSEVVTCDGAEEAASGVVALTEIQLFM